MFVKVKRTGVALYGYCVQGGKDIFNLRPDELRRSPKRITILAKFAIVLVYGHFFLITNCEVAVLE